MCYGGEVIRPIPAGTAPHGAIDILLKVVNKMGSESPGAAGKTIMKNIVIILSLFLYIGFSMLSCGKYAYPPDPDELDTTEIDTVYVPTNIRVDSLKIYYATIVDSVTGTLIDSATLGSFVTFWDTAYGADLYSVLLWDGLNNLSVFHIATNGVKFDGLPPNQTYRVKVQGLNLLSTGDTVFSDTSDTFAVAELYQPDSPKNVSVRYDNMTARVSWQPATGVGILGYRAYLRDVNGDSIDFVDDSSRSIALFTVEEDYAYKVNVVTISGIGMSQICSTHVYDVTAPAGSGLKLPYLYLSTFETPSEDEGTSIILGKGTMLGITGGIFAMGDIWSDSSSGNGKPVHEVVVSSFFLSRIEISNKLFVQFLNEYNGIDTLLDSTGIHITFLLHSDTLLAPCSHIVLDTTDSLFTVSVDTANYPVTGIYWQGAAAFCNWLSAKDNFKSCYDTSNWSFDTLADGYRLPTEAEYEYVHSSAFLGTKQRYPWGYADNQNNYGSVFTGFNKTGTFPAFYGFYDLTGNTLEWCHDWSDHLAGVDSSYYLLSLQQGVVYDPCGPSTGPYHVLRGGSYLMTGEKCTSAYRHVYPGSDVSGYGFRVARSYK